MPFSDETLRFLFEVRINDSRVWFHENHDRYEQHVITPVRELIDSLAPMMLSIDPQLTIDGRVGRCISRINRDTRFTKNKELYRDVVWISFVREKHAELPEFFFEFSARGLRWGCGWYCAPKDTVETLREMVLADAPLWREAENAVSEDSCLELFGDRYKRTRHPEADAVKRKWLDMKDFCVMGVSEDIDMLFSPELPDWLGREFLKMKPVYELFLAARLLSKGRQTL